MWKFGEKALRNDRLDAIALGATECHTTPPSDVSSGKVGSLTTKISINDKPIHLGTDAKRAYELAAELLKGLPTGSTPQSGDAAWRWEACESTVRKRFAVELPPFHTDYYLHGPDKWRAKQQSGGHGPPYRWSRARSADRITWEIDGTKANVLCRHGDKTIRRADRPNSGIKQAGWPMSFGHGGADDARGDVSHPAEIIDSPTSKGGGPPDRCSVTPCG